MDGTEPGDRHGGDGDPGRRLARPPSERYGASPTAGQTQPDGAPTPQRPAWPGPLARAVAAAAAGSALLVVVGAVLASTTGLLFVAGAMGAAVGLLLARAALPRDDALALPRRTVTWVAVGLSLAGVVGAAVGTWLIARDEGGTLGLLDYLWTTFGPFVPGEAIIATLAAAWAANAGPVQR